MSDPTCVTWAEAGECVGQWRCGGPLGCIFGAGAERSDGEERLGGTTGTRESGFVALRDAPPTASGIEAAP